MGEGRVALPTIYISHLEFSLWPVYFEFALLTANYIEWIKRILPYLPHPLANFIFQTFFWSFGFFYLILAHLCDPGYLPFFYPAVPSRHFTSDDLKSGTATTKEQLDWARRQRRPARIALGCSIGRFVIRGDHVCAFTGNWVGLYNHRYFILAISYLTISIALYLATIIYEWFNDTLILSYIELILILAHAVPFLATLGSNLLTQFDNIARNVTTVDRFRKRVTHFDRGCVNNFAEVCGSKKYWWLWWAPIPLPREIDGFGFGEIDPAILAEPAPWDHESGSSDPPFDPNTVYQPVLN
jgi:hypothetical protein